MKNLNWYAIVVLLFGYLSSGDLVYASTYYVSKAGRDTNPGTEAQPFLTMNQGVSKLIAGDTLYVKAGTYVESLQYNIPSGTSWTNKVRIAAYPNDTVWIKPSSGTTVIAFAGEGGAGNNGSQHYIELDGINVDGSNITSSSIRIESGYTYNAHHIRVKNAEIIASKVVSGGGLTGGSMCILITADDEPATGSLQGFNEFSNLVLHHAGGPGTAGYGFYIQSSDNVVDTATIYDVTGACISVYNGHNPGDQEASRNTIRGVTCHDVTVIDVATDPRTQGIVVGRGHNNLIYNNLIYNIQDIAGSQSYGIEVFHAYDTQIYNNTVFNASHGAILDNGTPGSSNTIFRNNILYGNRLGDYENDGTGTVASNNMCSSGCNVNGNPLFTNSAAGDFTLQAGSGAIDAGMTLSNMFTIDIRGTVRPSGNGYDIGAYEFGKVAPKAPSGLRIVGN
jgi:hypothetical protein